MTPTPTPTPVHVPVPLPVPVPGGQSSSLQPQHTTTGQPQQQQVITYGGVQLPAGIAANPELLKLFMAQIQAGAGRKPRPIAPLVKASTGGGGTLGEDKVWFSSWLYNHISLSLSLPTYIADKSKPLGIIGKPPPLSQGSSNAVVVVPRSGGSSLVQVSSSRVKPPLQLATPTPPSLTPPPKRLLTSHPPQSVSPVSTCYP